MSLSKYFGTPRDPNGNPLYWSNPENFPFRGLPPTMLKDDEIDGIPLVYDAKVAVLTLPGDEQRYAEIIDHCANGWWSLRYEKQEWDQKEGKYHILISWLEIYGETPTSKSAWEAIKNAPTVHY